MLGIHAYWLFLSTGIVLNLTPGQDTMFIIGRSLVGGRRSGVAAAFGIAAGTVVHTLAAALGLSMILATSARAFAAVKLLGAAYLIYLGVRLIVQKSAIALDSPASKGTATMRSSFLQGIATNVLNPKVALFFLAFLPQFIDPASTTKTTAFLALGATFITTGFIWCLVLATAASRLQGFFSRHVGARVALGRTVGALFVGLGLRLAWSRSAP
jgi:threonine/homoserine/homoserine lactone efflux protein